jgi:hypothetical protein
MAGFLEMIEVIDESPYVFSFVPGFGSQDNEDARLSSLRITDSSESHNNDQLSGSVAKTVLMRYVNKI